MLEADVVLPITCARDPQAWAYAGLYGIVPWFTDSQTQNRWRHDCAVECKSKKETRLRAAKEVAWLLGIQPVIAVVPGPLGEVDSVFFGNVDAVEKAINEAASDRSIDCPAEKVDLVVASIDGDNDQQSWENVARVLFLAENFLNPEGTVAVITRLRKKPGNVFRWLNELEGPESTEQHLMRSSHPQWLAAIEIHRVRQRHTVYLMSQLPAETVEELGMGAISEVEEIEHLIASHGSCLVISGAQHRWVSNPS